MAQHTKRVMKKAAGPPKTVREARTPKPEETERPLRPSQCRAYMRNALAREFRGIVQGFVEGAKSGSCQHVKLATELVRSPERKRVSGRGHVQRLVEQLERETPGSC